MLQKLLCVAVVLAVAACSKAPESAPPSAAKAVTPATPAVAPEKAPAGSGIAWEKGDVDAAFAKARAENKPVFLYWGAVWCPPCNQVKATLFSRQDFIDRSRFFVPVYLDGDSRSAQRQGARFKVGGYPTMILFTPDGTEITRLPGEADAEQYMQVLALGMGGARPVKATLAAALAKGSAAQPPLSADDWRMLAYYSWDTDEQALIPKKDLAATLRRLAQACPPAETVTAARLKLKALAAEAKAPGAKPADDPGARDELAKMLANPQVVRESFDLVTGYPREITGQVSLPKSDGRAALVAAWDAVLVRLARVAPGDVQPRELRGADHPDQVPLRFGRLRDVRRLVRRRRQPDLPERQFDHDRRGPGPAEGVRAPAERPEPVQPRHDHSVRAPGGCTRQDRRVQPGRQARPDGRG